MSSIPPNELSLSQKASSILRQNNTGALSTLSVKHENFPFASVASYSVDATGRPIFFFSSMATHSKNVRSNPNASLLVTANESETGGSLAEGRLTLIGTVQPVNAEDADAQQMRVGYLEANPEAKRWAEFGDFQFYRMELVDIYCVAGFGSMGWIAPEEFSL